jgi:hypothetical protein
MQLVLFLCPGLTFRKDLLYVSDTAMYSWIMQALEVSIFYIEVLLLAVK